MADIVDRVTRSRMMSGIRGKDTKPEQLVRSYLHRRGFRYRLHSRKLPGNPDLVLPKHNAVILVHGCYWHRHPGCKLAYEPKTRKEFWRAKFERNVERDAEVRHALLDAGWRVMVIWECGLRTHAVREQGLETIVAWLRSDLPTSEYPRVPVLATADSN